MASDRDDSLYEKVHSRLKKHMNRHIARHINLVHNHIRRIHHELSHTTHIILHVWELILVALLSFWWLMHAWSANLPNNSSFSYPLKKVSTVDCRTLYWEDMPDSCKINLPIIRGANYTAYQWNSLYRSIYTTMRAAPYSNTWDQTAWAHAWVDIATARGTPIYSIWNGVVFYAWRNSSYGNVIKVKYVYKWEIVYAVYAHLDTIEVSAWDTVTRWQKIWTTWNSGNTFGALGWYHLHFEIDKDNWWRPAYSYTNCADVSKWHYTIIQNGLCRQELFKYQYDPIRVLEWVATPSLDELTRKESVENVENNIIVKVEDEKQNNEPVVIEEESHDSANNQQQNNESVVDNNSQNNNTVENKPVEEKSVENNNTQNNQSVNNDSQNNNSQDTQPVENKPVDNQQPVEENPVENNSQPVVDNNTSVVVPETNPQPSNESQNDNQNKDPEIIDLNFDKLTKLNQHFMTQWDVEMKSKLNVRSLNVWETLTIELELFKKWTADNREYYNNGMLQVPFEFINNNDNISLNITSLQLLSKWKWTIEITGVKPGFSAVVLQIWWEKIWVLNINVK